MVIAWNFVGGKHCKNVDVIFFENKMKWFFLPKQISVHFDFEIILQMFTLVAGAVHVMDNVMDNVIGCYGAMLG